MNENSEKTIQASQLTVPAQVAVQLKTLEYDKVIAEARAQVANLEAQKAQFLYESNLKSIQQQYQNIIT